MPLTSNGSYIPTANEFLAHWSQADSALTASGGLVLPGQPGVIPTGFNRSGLVVLRDTLRDTLDLLQDKLNTRQIAQSRLEQMKAKMLKRLLLFNGLLDGYYTSTVYYAARPEAPGIGVAEEKFCAPMRDMKSLWSKLNGAPAPAGVTLPIQLNEGTDEEPEMFDRTDFVQDLTLLQQYYEDRAAADQEIVFARKTRDKLFSQIRAVLVAYRAAAETKLAPHPVELASLPRLSPLPGHTPDPVTASATFVPPDTARITHSESDDSDFAGYRLLGAPGEDADMDDAAVLETHTGRTPVPFTTTLGLTEPGGAGSYWIIVYTSTGNERASERMVVNRPL